MHLSMSESKKIAIPDMYINLILHGQILPLGMLFHVCVRRELHPQFTIK